MIREQIFVDLINARRSRDFVTVTTLSTLLGEIQKAENSGDHLSDDKIYNIIKKFVANIEEIETLTIGNITEEKITALLKEKELYKKYLPSFPSLEEYSEIIKEYYLNAADKNFGALMKGIKSYMESKNIPFDGKTISSILKALPNAVY